jgi:hypothetical protein
MDTVLSQHPSFPHPWKHHHGLETIFREPRVAVVHIHHASVLVGVLGYLVAAHLCLLRLSLRLSHGVLVLPLRQIVEPWM